MDVEIKKDRDTCIEEQFRKKEKGREIMSSEPSFSFFPPSLYLFILLTLYRLDFFSVLSLNNYHKKILPIHNDHA